MLRDLFARKVSALLRQSYISDLLDSLGGRTSYGAMLPVSCYLIPIGGVAEVWVMNGLKVGLGILTIGAGGLGIAWVASDCSAPDRIAHSARSGDRSASSASDPPAVRPKCDLVAQTGCGPGERCDYQCVDKSTQLGCFPDVGGGEISEACNAENPCRKGSYCAAKPMGCTAYCKTDADCPDGMACGMGLLTFCGPAIRVPMCFKRDAAPK